MRRWAIRVLCWLALGTAASILVGWGVCHRSLRLQGGTKFVAYPVKYYKPVAAELAGRWWTFACYRGLAFESCRWVKPADSQLGATINVLQRASEYERWNSQRVIPQGGIESSLPAWTDVPSWRGLPQSVVMVDSFAAGWPVLCVNGNSAMSFVGPARTPTDSPVRTVKIGDWLVPYRVMPPGLLVDTLFYALPIALLWLTPGYLRRWHRRRHHLCIHCSYPVGDPAKPCSECGKFESSQSSASR